MKKSGRPITDVLVKEGTLSQVNYSGKKVKDIPKVQYIVSTKEEPKVVSICDERELLDMAVKKNIVLSGKL